jgi:membrane-bound lytic murein transglycosylase D
MKRWIFVWTMVGLTSIRALYATAAGEGMLLKPTADDPVWGGLPPVYFCGEAVPIHEEAVARRLLSTLLKNTNYVQALSDIRQRASQFFPIIEPILEQYKIPADFKYLPLAESSLRSGAVSAKGAAGYWQLMPETARELGLTVQTRLDERHHLLKSTHAACRYLRFLHEQLGTWTLAAAAYNNGIGNLLVSIRKQRERDYYYLRLNAETGRYLYRILAFKELFGNYQSYRAVLPPHVWKTLSEPLPHLTPNLDAEESLVAESMVTKATRQAVEESLDAEPSVSKQPQDLQLPHGSDVFRNGIKARLTQAGNLQRGEVWLFNLTRDAVTNTRPMEQGDILYALVEDIDSKTNKIYLRVDRIYSLSARETYNLTLSAIDASTGSLGINLDDVGQVKSGWISTWKVQ